VDALHIDRAQRVWIFAIGKAARPMATAAVTSLLRSLHSIVGGVVVTPEGGPSPYPTIVSMPGDHPVPGRNSFAAAAKIAEVTRGRRGTDSAIVLISGGTSSLIGAPLSGMNESDFAALCELLLGSGLDIASMNTVRKRFSRWGAGRLALALAPAATHCLAVSDVAGDDLSVIGSGPCSPDPSTVEDVTNVLKRAHLLTRIPQAQRDYLAAVARGTIPDTPTRNHPAFAHVTARVIGSNRIAVEAAAAAAASVGLSTEIGPLRLVGEAAVMGEAIARQLVEARIKGASRRCFLWGGETTVTTNGAEVTSGGRCQELALAAARVLDDAGDHGAGITILAAGTDGRDGATDAAGAVVDRTSWRAIAGHGDAAQMLATHQSNAALRVAGALIPRRETGTNVNDLVVGLVG
jgi:glycerate-2-kinase